MGETTRCDPRRSSPIGRRWEWKHGGPGSGTADLGRNWRVALGAALLGIGLGTMAVRAARDAEITSRWRTMEITVDGKGTGWPALERLAKTTLSGAFVNDAKVLYVCIVTSDAARGGFGPSGGDMPGGMPGGGGRGGRGGPPGMRPPDDMTPIKGWTTVKLASGQ